MIDSTRAFYLSKYALPLLIVVWCLNYMFSGVGPAYSEVMRNFKDERKLFVDDFLENEIDGRFDGTGLKDLCSRTKWDPDLVLTCDPSPGGLGVVKNSNLNCLRFAIEMGARVVLPQVIKRSADDITQLIPGNPKGRAKSVFLDYFWDYDHLNRTLSTYCPQMRIHKTMDELWDVPSMLTWHGMSVNELEVPVVNETVIQNMTFFRERIKTYMEDKAPHAKRKSLTRFNLAPTYWAWPTETDSVSLASNLGRLLRVREDARRLAAAALFNLEKRFQLNLDPRNGIKRESFVGIHLRTEADASGDGAFPTYEEQAAYYLEYIARSKSPVVFMATGASFDNVTAFTERAKDFNVTVVRKQDLLEGADLELLEETFTYDQRALVDYEIMLRAGLVAGPSQSSFAWNLAMRRVNAYGNVGNSTPQYETKNIQWQDRYSTIFGHTVKGAAMQATIWP